MRVFFVKHEKKILTGAAFFLPFVFCLCICIMDKVYPFGDRCILHVDMYHQYCPFFLELMDKLKSGGSLMYSWTAGVGSDFVALYAYYLASPLNWLILLFPRHLVIEFMTALVLVKIGTCGLSFYLFLQYRARRAGAAEDGALSAAPDEEERRVGGLLRALAALVFSCAYAMSGFVAAYSWDIMWMDCVALMPLAAMGLLKMIRDKKPALYYLSLALCILSNYYLAIMICIFLCFYFVLIMAEEKGGWKDLMRFVLYSLLAGGTAAVLLIPELKILSYSGSSGISKPEFSWYFGILQELSRLSTTAEPYTANDHWPNLYVGAFSLILLVLYALNREISWKRKVPRLLMVVFFLLSFANSWLDFFWHGLHFPDSLPGREAFLFAFVMLALAYEAATHLSGMGLWHIGAGIVSWMILLAAAYYTTDEAVAEPMAIAVTGILVICYGMFAALLLLGRGRERRNLAILACILALSELVLNMAVTGFSTTSRTLYVEHMEHYETLLREAKEQSGGTFYRVEDTQRKTKNDSALYNYPSATQFSSLMNINVSHFYQRMYMEGGKNFYCYNGQTPLLSAMLSVKYQISDSPTEEGALMHRLYLKDGQYLYENLYTLPMGFIVPEDLEGAWDADRDKIVNINDLGYRLGSLGDILTETAADAEEDEGTTTITVQEEGYYYAASRGNSADSLTVTNSRGFQKKYAKTSHKYLLGLGHLEAGDTATVKNSNSESISFSVYRLDLNAVDAAYQTLRAQTLDMEEFSDTGLSGTIDVTKPGRLFFSIPSEEGWTLYVDGEKTQIQDFAETFISVSLGEGRHEIRLRYVTPGLLPGAMISGACVLAFAGAMVVHRRRLRQL